ncbi:deoxynucleoside triphosphate triphosphohydrolase SAMHD1 [Acrasis kona]|uniref:Deoxynucleoside triphosphate triphosphohydrolase SAMHD1 n=1 Tax=Acrasis kona TaxID=1008807 RepID=A0AAW2YW16_9EUKA
MEDNFRTPTKSAYRAYHEVDIPTFKTYNDPIHGHIRIDKEIMQFVDTPQFQRLRDLKQLGSCYFVFPGATNNRFEHCIGVSHLAEEWMTSLKISQPYLEITEREQFLVKVAALCHDLGHGPFSHVFDNEFIPRAFSNVPLSSRWCHEDGSLMMFDYLLEDNNIDMDKADADFVKNLILGNVPEDSDRKFLYQIVANKTNSIDVDKFDYLQRDSMNLGYKSSYDATRLLKFSKVINDEICFSSKEVYNLYEMFHTRYSLHKQVYSHRVGKAVEYMITDALLKADPVLKLSEAIYDKHKYVNLTDGVLRSIEASQDPELNESRSIIRRLRTRNLYKFVDEVLLSNDQYEIKITESDIASCSDGKLKPDHVIVHNLVINYAMKDKNPVDNVRFYQQGNPNSFNIKKEQVSMLIPDSFSERSIRLYVRDASHSEAAHHAFQKCLKRFNFDIKGSKGSPSPFKKTKPEHLEVVPQHLKL